MRPSGSERIVVETFDRRRRRRPMFPTSSSLSLKTIPFTDVFLLTLAFPLHMRLHPDCLTYHGRFRPSAIYVIDENAPVSVTVSLNRLRPAHSPDNNCREFAGRMSAIKFIPSAWSLHIQSVWDLTMPISSMAHHVHASFFLKCRNMKTILVQIPEIEYSCSWTSITQELKNFVIFPICT